MKNLLLVITFVISFSPLLFAQTWNGNNTTTGVASIGTSSATAYKLRIYNSNAPYSLHNSNNYAGTSTKYGIYNRVNGAGTGTRYGIYNFMDNSSKITYGVYSQVAYNASNAYTFYSRYGKVGMYHSSFEFDNLVNNKWTMYTGGQSSDLNFYITPKDNNGNPIWGRSFSIKRAGTIHQRANSNNPAIVVERVGWGNVFQVDGYGKVMIGNGITMPGNYMLYVRDGILTERVKVAMKNTSQWADYVFAPSYSLMPLKQLETYIKKHKHLPNIPSAQDIVEDGGVELKEMTRLQMEKIEELTLYIIQQQKEIDALRAEIEKLK